MILWEKGLASCIVKSSNFCSAFQWDGVNHLAVLLDNTPLLPALWDFNEGEDSFEKKSLFNYQ